MKPTNSVKRPSITTQRRALLSGIHIANTLLEQLALATNRDSRYSALIYALLTLEETPIRREAMNSFALTIAGTLDRNFGVKK
jgi:hypothetical protein